MIISPVKVGRIINQRLKCAIRNEIEIEIGIAIEGERDPIAIAIPSPEYRLFVRRRIN